MQPSARLWRLPFALLGIAACQPAARGAAQQPMTDTDVTLERVYAAPHSGVSAAGRLVIRDATAWQATWRDVVGHLTPAPALPAVDFSRAMIVVAAMGERGTGGYEIRVTRAYRRDGDLVVVVVEVSPGAGCMLIQSITAPVEVVRLPRHDGPVTFLEEQERRDCL